MEKVIYYDFKKNNKQLSIIEFSPKKKENNKERRR